MAIDGWAISGCWTIKRGLAAIVCGASVVLNVGCGDSGSRNDEAGKPGPPNVSSTSAALAVGHVDAGKKLLSEGQYADAVDQFTTALEEANRQSEPKRTASSEADVYFQRGMAYLKMGFPDTAAEDFTAVIRLVPKDGAAYERRGYAQMLLGDSYNALRDCTEAIRLQPENPLAYRTRGEVYADRRQFNRASADLEQAVAQDQSLSAELAPTLASIYQGWSQQLADAGDAAAASARLADARRWNANLPLVVGADPAPSLPETEVTVAKPVLTETEEHFLKGRELQLQERHDQAIIEFTAAVTQHPDFAEAYLRRGETLLAMGFPDTALEDFATAIRLGGKSAEACRLQAKAFLAYKRPYRASESATDSLHFDPSDAATYAIRGEAYLRMEVWDRAIADLTEAIRRDPELAEQVQPLIEQVEQAEAEAAGEPLAQTN